MRIVFLTPVNGFSLSQRNSWLLSVDEFVGSLSSACSVNIDVLIPGADEDLFKCLSSVGKPALRIRRSTSDGEFEMVQELLSAASHDAVDCIIVERQQLTAGSNNSVRLCALLRLLVVNTGCAVIDSKDFKRAIPVLVEARSAVDPVKASFVANFFTAASLGDKIYADAVLVASASTVTAAAVAGSAAINAGGGGVVSAIAGGSGGTEVVLVIGSGGREHAIVRSLSKSPTVAAIFASPGNFGTSQYAERGSSNASRLPCIQNVPELMSAASVVGFVRDKGVTLVAVGPEQPLVDGLADVLAAEGIACFGPSQRAAEIESSKAWSKNFMQRHQIRTADFAVFTDFDDAEQYLNSIQHRVVVKASGLAAGKGVLLPTSTAEAIEGVRAMLLENMFGSAGSEVVIEEFLDGEEVSVLAFCDGSTAVGMPPAQDHKRALDGDQGLNTGGMGAYAPTPIITAAEFAQCMAIVQESVTAMKSEGRPFVGVLYAGFIMTKEYGPVVLEFNCRFGDPETQVLLPLLHSDLCCVMRKCVEGNLKQEDVVWMQGDGSVACTVVCAAPGYPSAYPKGLPIYGLDDADGLPNVTVYHAGTKAAPAPPAPTSDAEDLIGFRSANSAPPAVTSGGRVLAVTGCGKTLQEAVNTAYLGISTIRFDGMHFRKDIAQKGLKRKVRLGVLGSTRGTDLQAIIDAIAREQLPLQAQIAVVISNKKSAGILERAAQHNLRHVHISAAGKEREQFDAEVSDELRQHGVDLVLLIGYMRIVSPLFVAKWRHRCLNVHPSLLPDFARGMDSDVHSAVIAAGKETSGCTIHLVTEEVDKGPIIVQKKCSVERPHETAESLKAKVQQLEGEAFLEAIQLFIDSGMQFSESVISGEHFLKGQIGDTMNSLSYRSAGVDIDAGEALVREIKPYCKATVRAGCDAELGGFGGLFDLAQSGFDAAETVLVSGTDGVGTKLKIAQSVGKHDTIGIDLVAMCANDILVCGAEPLFFLDYYATGRLQVKEAAQVVKGIAEGCRLAGAALIGGETAEMAGMYRDGEYDLAGFCVGAVKRDAILPRPDNAVQPGDVLIGIPSSGIHSNGFSLVRKCVEKAQLDYSDPAPFQPNVSLGEALLTPTRIYVKQVLPLIRRGFIKALAHITGGGILDNLPRVLPSHVMAEIRVDEAGWRLPPVFRWLQGVACLSQHELMRTFNCGIGMVLIVDRIAAPMVVQELFSTEDRALVLGTIKSLPDGSAPQVRIVGELF